MSIFCLHFINLVCYYLLEKLMNEMVKTAINIVSINFSLSVFFLFISCSHQVFLWSIFRIQGVFRTLNCISILLAVDWWRAKEIRHFIIYFSFPFFVLFSFLVHSCSCVVWLRAQMQIIPSLPLNNRRKKISIRKVLLSIFQRMKRT